MKARSYIQILSIQWAFAITFALFMVACQPGTDHQYETGTPVLDADGNSLGSLAFKTTCSGPADDAMRRGMGLLHHMTSVEAETAFASAAQLDPACALSYWGQALTYVHPLWPDVPSPDAFQQGAALLVGGTGYGKTFHDSVERGR